jgi:hypothetical protein
MMTNKSGHMTNESGQGMLLWAGLMVMALAFTGLVVDGGLYYAHHQRLQYDLDVACVAAGNFGVPNFWVSLANNGVTADATIVAGPEDTFLTTAEEPHEFYLSQFMGFESMDVAVQSRCLKQRGGIAPIAVQEPWYLDSYDTGDPYPILGSGADAENQPGNDFPGGVLTQLWCVDGAPCNQWLVFEPIPQDYSSSSCQPYKEVASDTIAGTTPMVFPPVGTHLPHIAGVSNNQLVKTGVDSGWDIGTELWVIVFDGNVYQANNANCDNLRVDYFTKATITAIDTNTIEAVLLDEPVYSLEEVLDQIVARTVPWDWEGRP